tara:strand:- start:965 stop:1261 length:297 start_codon:yes stop_codon:yes gene_type:complete
MKRVNVYLPEELLERLQQQADYEGVPRSDFIRKRLSAPSNSLGITTRDFHETVAKVRKRYSYGLDRQQAESIVAAVISELFNQSQNDPNRELSILPGQ